MGLNNDIEREPVRGVIGNSGAMPMYYVSKRNNKMPYIQYSRRTRFLAYIIAAIAIYCFLGFYWILTNMWLLRPIG